MSKGKTLITIVLVLVIIATGVLLFFKLKNNNNKTDSIVGTYEREVYDCTEETPGYNETLDVSYIEFKEDDTFKIVDNNCFSKDEFHGTYKLLDNNQIEFTFASDSASFEDIKYIFEDNKVKSNNIEFTKK